MNGWMNGKGEKTRFKIARELVVATAARLTSLSLSFFCAFMKCNSKRNFRTCALLVYQSTGCPSNCLSRQIKTIKYKKESSGAYSVYITQAHATWTFRRMRKKIHFDTNGTGNWILEFQFGSSNVSMDGGRWQFHASQINFTFFPFGEKDEKRCLDRPRSSSLLLFFYLNKKHFGNCRVCVRCECT